tara:strand:+ start:12024 stop:12662 length:639 start_codon:yes stop_codon:yes gene_type:complete
MITYSNHNTHNKHNTHNYNNQTNQQTQVTNNTTNNKQLNTKQTPTPNANNKRTFFKCRRTKALSFFRDKETEGKETAISLRMPQLEPLSSGLSIYIYEIEEKQVALSASFLFQRFSLTIHKGLSIMTATTLTPEGKSTTTSHSKLSDSEQLGFQTAKRYAGSQHVFETYSEDGSPNFNAVCDYAHAAYHSINPDDTKQHMQIFQAALQMVQY